MSKARRNKQARRNRATQKPRRVKATSIPTEQEAADAALARLARRLDASSHSIAELYALGYLELGYQQVMETTPDWMHETNALDLIILGITRKNFRSGHEFLHIRSAWLQEMRRTPHWRDIEKFVSVAVELSRASGLALDDGDLMFRLIAYLEDAGIDKRKIPAALRPNSLLANMRLARDYSKSPFLPQPTAETAQLAEEYIADLAGDREFPQSYASTLRDALLLFERAKLPILEDSLSLLLALYAGVAGSNEIQVTDLAASAEAWARGVADSSPLAPIVDTILSCATAEIGTVETLARLFAIPAFLEPTTTELQQRDVRPASDITQIAHELGYRSVEFSDHKAVTMGPLIAAQLKHQVRLFEERFGHPPAPEDPIHKGIDYNEERLRTLRLLTTLGVHPALNYAFEVEDLIPGSREAFLTPKDETAWQSAVDRYIREHPEDGAPDLDEEFAKIRTISAFLTLQSAAGDTDLAKAIVAILNDSTMSYTNEVAAIIEFLDGMEEDIVEVAADIDSLGQILKVATSWGGSTLRKRVQDWIDDDYSAFDPVSLFVVASVWWDRSRNNQRRT
ncbi:hypothetical protein [Actinokineospora diospyrosa]|uniref:Uncharacterized protein n=1 Tax=Actinokineospora diospyrosa TaxID=103728 RepID=A0ABT1IKP8_9PSEU|nr:hypothetical protein [Actinokineospora diospyrosa]MCP2273227.1 hypothetical protein [Actinokineospora diospyrosa]